MKLMEWGLAGLLAVSNAYGWQDTDYTSYEYVDRDVSRTVRSIVRDLDDYRVPRNVWFRVLSDEEFEALEKTLPEYDAHGRAEAVTVPLRHRRTKEFLGWDIVIRDNATRGYFTGDRISLGEAVERGLHEVQHVRNMIESGLMIREHNSTLGEYRARAFEENMEEMLKGYGIRLK